MNSENETTKKIYTGPGERAKIDLNPDMKKVSEMFNGIGFELLLYPLNIDEKASLSFDISSDREGYKVIIRKKTPGNNIPNIYDVVPTHINDLPVNIVEIRNNSGKTLGIQKYPFRTPV